MNKLEVLNRYPRNRMQLLRILHALQAENPTKSLTREDLRLVAEYLDLPLSAVHDAVTFYSMLSLRPRGRHIIRLCDSPACHLLGAESILAKLTEFLGVKAGETTTDGLFTLELVSCLGLCDIAPAMMVDDQVFGNLTPEKIAKIINRYRREQ